MEDLKSDLEKAVEKLNAQELNEDVNEKNPAVRGWLVRRGGRRGAKAIENKRKAAQMKGNPTKAEKIVANARF